MSVETIKEGLSQSEAAARDYVDATAEQLKLQTFKFAMKLVVNGVKALVLGASFLLTLMFLSLALGYFLNTLWQSEFLGFLATGAFFLIAGVAIYLLRSRIERPVLRNFSRHYFEE
jgi:hypothetical protein